MKLGAGREKVSVRQCGRKPYRNWIWLMVTNMSGRERLVTVKPCRVETRIEYNGKQSGKEKRMPVSFHMSIKGMTEKYGEQNLPMNQNKRGVFLSQRWIRIVKPTPASHVSCLRSAWRPCFGGLPGAGVLGWPHTWLRTDENKDRPLAANRTWR